MSRQTCLKVIKVVIGIIKNSQSEFLIAQRQAKQDLAGFWEFPGGKIEPNEAAFDALVRELHEEVDIQVVAADPFTQIHYDYPEKSVLLDFWHVSQFKGQPKGKEGQVIKWISKNELANYPFPAANQSVLKMLL